MTEQEEEEWIEEEARAWAELWAARLERIWGPLSREPRWTWADELFSFECRTEDHVHLTFELNFNELCTVAVFSPAKGNQHTLPNVTACRFYCVQDGLNIATIDWDNVPRFNEHYLPLFRCKAWLSGINIEASAHEKAEWMQGFTREELQAWNLKF